MMVAARCLGAVYIRKFNIQTLGVHPFVSFIVSSYSIDISLYCYFFFTIYIRRERGMGRGWEVGAAPQ
jgi:hypothetical protein